MACQLENSVLGLDSGPAWDYEPEISTSRLRDCGITDCGIVHAYTYGRLRFRDFAIGPGSMQTTRITQT